MNIHGPLTRSSSDKILGGVCGGLARYLGVDAGIIRLITAIAIIFFGTGVLLYILLWVLLPSDNSSTTGFDTIVSQFKSHTNHTDPNPGDYR